MIPERVDHGGLWYRFLHAVGGSERNRYAYVVDFRGRCALVGGKRVDFQAFGHVWVNHFQQSRAPSTLDLHIGGCNLCECFSGRPDEISALAREIGEAFQVMVMNDCGF